MRIALKKTRSSALQRERFSNDIFDRIHKDCVKCVPQTISKTSFILCLNVHHMRSFEESVLKDIVDKIYSMLKFI